MLGFPDKKLWLWAFKLIKISSDEAHESIPNIIHVSRRSKSRKSFSHETLCTLNFSSVGSLLRLEINFNKKNQQISW